MRELRVVGPDTDLTLGVAGRPWVAADGRLNMPDGEVFTSPVETETRGEIRFQFPAIYEGREVEDVRLRFEGGEVTQAEAARGGDYLEALLAMEGARVLGEVAFGLNYEIDRFTRNILFDEKIGGTMHFALGSGFRAGRRKEQIGPPLGHDLRPARGGEVYADGELVWRAGRFLEEVVIAVVADTHLPRGGRTPSGAVSRASRGGQSRRPCGRLHGRLGPERAGGAGFGRGGSREHGRHELRRRLPDRTVVEAEGLTIGVVHDAGPAAGRGERLRAAFPGCDLVVYGHSHVPELAHSSGVWILNPGSPTERRRAPSHTMAVVRDGVPELVQLERAREQADAIQEQGAAGYLAGSRPAWGRAAAGWRG